MTFYYLTISNNPSLKENVHCAKGHQYICFVCIHFPNTWKVTVRNLNKGRKIILRCYQSFSFLLLQKTVWLVYFRLHDRLAACSSEAQSDFGRNMTKHLNKTQASGKVQDTRSSHMCIRTCRTATTISRPGLCKQKANHV